MKVPESNRVAATDRVTRPRERLSVAPPVRAVLEALLREAAATLSASGVFMCWREDESVPRTLATPALPADALEVCGQRLLNGPRDIDGALLTYVSVDLERDVLLAGEPEARRKLGAVGLVSLPLSPSVDRGVVGVLCAVLRQGRVPSEEDLQRCGLYARLAGLALERELAVEGTRVEVARARAEVEQAEVLRLSRFQAVTEAFGQTLTREEVAHVVLDLGLPAVDAMAGMVHLTPEGGASAELIAAVGVPDGLLEPLRVLPRTGEDLPGYDAVLAEAPVWLETLAAIQARYPRLAALMEEGPLRALALAPLFVEGRVFGTLAFGFEREKDFTALERESIIGLSRQCGQALERARLYEREHTARLEAEALGARLSLLADASALVSGSLGWEDTVAGVARLALGHFADGCSVDSYEEGVVRRLAVLHASPEKAQRVLELTSFPLDSGQPSTLARVLASGQSRMETRKTRAVSEVDGASTWSISSLILTPLVARQRTLGALTFVRDAGRAPFDATDLSLAEELTRRAAMAMDNARLFRDARAAEEESRRSAARLHVLVQVSQLIAEAGLDLPTVLDVLASKVSEALGGGCVLQLLAEEGEQLELVAAHHPDPVARGVLESSLRMNPARVGEGLSGRVVATGQTLFVPRLSAEELQGDRSPEGVTFLERYGPQSLIIVPLGARGRVLGTLGVIREARGREYTAEERALLESLAARAALAIEDARLYGAATQAVKARDELLSVAGHELKSPLNALQLQIHLLARMAKDAMAASGLAERAEKAARAGQRLGLLIDDLLDVSRISAGRLSLNLEEVDLAALTRELVSRMSEELVRAGSEVRMLADDAVVGQWDKLRLEQVLVNLLSNAAKYGAGRPVTVRVEPRGAVAELVVQDEGIGVAQEDQERIFERFERSESAQHFKGLGLGLWITKRIVEAHGGGIRVQSQPGKGSIFTVELPLSDTLPT
ncbi:GAF domain-containing protein [Myxococcus llanfairpwllgwyngyllgogerychwyrndrobwllllantysiliogogogochensis]|uniref:histidine kinase n=1 Tax=Myxococcus llanfairpwllgwyngyllgogerychwyrndrobwllllantysiliogogogochensis TaxID=2590453 RepID=A0A540WN57_9BACT|nr:GAF domain-containing protein [Myxococcus llanfairpwllgwyngyllgogerychwyrndrobwllllantysiliogogogochensis]TQF10277.1 GAF domain-containing protein [Myxococcus llanfairpwllgwyngyllgogerychwyrndrobwllllantysiliogogogochensis]